MGMTYACGIRNCELLTDMMHCHAVEKKLARRDDIPTFADVRANICNYKQSTSSWILTVGYVQQHLEIQKECITPVS